MLWTATVAVVLFLQVAQKGTESFKERARQIFNVTLIFDFLANLYAFGLLVELVLVPLLLLVGGVLAVSQTKEEYKPVERLLSNVMVLFGTVVLIYAVYSIYSNWSSFARVQTAKDFFRFSFGAFAAIHAVCLLWNALPRL